MQSVTNEPAHNVQADSAVKAKPPPPFPLPNELLHMILLDFSLPASPGYDQPTTDRLSALSSFCLVSKTWRTIAQPQLPKHLHFSTPAKAVAFLEAIRTRPEVAQAVKTLRVGQLGGPAQEAAPFRLGEILTRCSNLEELRVSAVVEMDLWDVNKAKSLRKLLIWATTVYTPTTGTTDKFLLPSLIHLYLTDVTFLSLPSHSILHSHAALPSLRACGEAFNSILISTPLPSISSPPYNFISDAGDEPEPHLLALSCATPLANAKLGGPQGRLKLLDCWTDEVNFATTKYLPEGLRVLRLNAFPEHGPTQQARSLEAFSEALDVHLAGLEYLVASSRGSVGRQPMKEVLVPSVPSPVYEKAVKVLEEVGRKRGFKVTLEVRDEVGEMCFFDGGLWEVVERLERELQAEKRIGLTA